MVCRCAPVGAGTCAHPRPTPARDARWRHAATHLQASDRHRAVRRGQLLRARRVSPSKASSLHHLQGLWCWEIFLGDFVRIENSERSPRLVPYLYLGMLVVDPTTLLSAPQVLGGAGVMECMPKCRRGRRAVPYNCRCCSLLALGASASCTDRQASDYCHQRQGCHPAAMCV